MSVDTLIKIEACNDEPVVKIDAGELDVMRWIRDVSGAAAARLRARADGGIDTGTRTRTGALAANVLPAIDAQARADAGMLTFTKFIGTATADLPHEAPLPSLPPLPADLDQVREQLPAARDFDAARFAAEARASSSPRAFRPAFSPAQWRTFASFCVVRRVPADTRVEGPGAADRTLRFVLEGCLGQDDASDALLPGDMLGADTLFTSTPGESGVRALEDSLILELPRSRHGELTAAHLDLGFELLRAAGAVVAARMRRCEA